MELVITMKMLININANVIIIILKKVIANNAYINLILVHNVLNVLVNMILIHYVINANKVIHKNLNVPNVEIIIIFLIIVRDVIMDMI